MIDETGPEAPVISGITPVSPTNAFSVIVSGKTEPGCKAGVYRDGTYSGWVNSDPLTGDFTMAVALELNTLNSIAIVAADKAGNVSVPYEVLVLQDSLPPLIIATDPDIEEPAVETISVIIITFSEEILESTIQNGIILKDQAGIEVPGAIALSRDKNILTFTPAQELTQGVLYSVTISPAITDEAGNSLPDSFAFNFTTGISTPLFKPVQPLVTGIYPQPPTSSNTVTLAGSTMTGTTISINGGLSPVVSIPDGNGNFTAIIFLRQNIENVIEVTASNEYGTSDPDILYIDHDASGPEISISSPSGGSKVTAPVIPVSGTAYDRNGVQDITINGIPAAGFGNSDFSTTVHLTGGINQIIVLAADILGNNTEKILMIEYEKEETDTQPPFITITEPQDGAVVGGSVPVKGTVVDSSGIAGCTINGISCFVQNGFFETVLELAGGSRKITVHAKDTMNLAGEVFINIIVDDIPPSRPLLDELPGMTTLLSFPVSGSAEPGARIIVENRGESTGGIVDESGKFIVPVRLFENDVNNLSVYAFDGAGNRSDTITAAVIQDTMPLSVMSISPGPGTRNVEPDTIITIEFNKPVSGESLQAPECLTVTSILDGMREPVPGTINLTPEGILVSFVPQLLFEQGAEIVVNLGAGIYSASDSSVHLDSSFTSNFIIIPPVTSVSGVVADPGLLPLAGATVMIGESYLKTKTNDKGGFRITRVPPGIQDIIIDGSTAMGNTRYAGLTIRMNVLAGKGNRIEKPVILVPIDETTNTNVSGNDDMTIDFHDQVPGLTLTVKGNALTFPDGKLNGTISATLVAPDAFPGRLPDGSLPVMLVMFEPRGTMIDPMATITFPNKGGNEPGESVIIFGFADGIHNYTELGKGIVNEDGIIITGTTLIPSLCYIGYKCEYPANLGPRYVKGKITDMSGQGIPDIPVSFLASDLDVKTDVNGMYAIPLPPGNFNGIKTYATVPLSFGSEGTEVLIYSSKPFTPAETGPTGIEDIVVDSLQLSIGMRFLNGFGGMIPNGENTRYDNKGNLVSLSMQYLLGIRMMLFRKTKDGQFSGTPLLTLNPNTPSANTLANIRFEGRIFNGLPGIGVPGEQSPVRIGEGEEIRIVAYSPGTGYIGIEDIAVPESGIQGTLVSGHIALRAPQVFVKVERLYYANNTRQRRIIPHGGVALTTDQLVLITTIWMSNGKVLPSITDIDIFGRLMVTSKTGTNRVQEKDLRFTIPCGESIRVVEIRGSFPDSQAIIDAITCPGSQFLEVAARRDFAGAAILPLTIAGPAGGYMPQTIKRFKFNVSSDTDSQALNVFGISVSAPDGGGYVTVTGKPGSVEPGSLVTVTNLTTGAEVAVAANDDGSFIAKIRASVHDIIQVIAQDAAGNMSDPVLIEVLIIPEISSIDPPAANTGEEIVISGKNFSVYPIWNQVCFATKMNTQLNGHVKSASVNSLTVLVPGGAVSGYVRVSVDGEVSAGSYFTVTSPFIKTIMPDKAMAGETCNVTIVGEHTHFTGIPVTKIDFGPFITVDSFSIVNDTEITAVITVQSGAAAGHYPVKVIHGEKELHYKASFIVLLPVISPVIEDMEPDPGEPLTIVTITGQNFRPVPAENMICFDNIITTAFESTAAEIKTMIPSDFRGGNVVVSIGDMKSDPYEYNVINASKKSTIAIGGTIIGEIRNYGVFDYYTFNAEAGTVITISCERIVNTPGGKGTLNPVVSLSNADGTLLAWDDDGGSETPPGPGKNALIRNFIIKNPGIYMISVWASIDSKPEGLFYLSEDEDKIITDFSVITSKGPYSLTLGSF